MTSESELRPKMWSHQIKATSAIVTEVVFARGFLARSYRLDNFNIVSQRHRQNLFHSRIQL